MGNVWGSISRHVSADPFRNYILPVHILAATVVVIVYQVGMMRFRALRRQQVVLQARAATLQAEGEVLSDRLRAEAAWLGRGSRRRRELELKAAELLKWDPPVVDFDDYERRLRNMCLWSLAFLFGSVCFNYFSLEA